MSRFKYQSATRDGNGKVLQSGTVSVFETGGSTPADIYEVSSGGTAVNSVTTDSNGYFFFWIDDGDYGVNQLFRLIISKTNFESKTYDDVTVPRTISFNLVDDTTPQLGGNLDMNGKLIQTVNETEMTYVKGVTSAIQTQIDATVKDTGNETIAGIKTFSSSPIVPEPITDFQVSTKKYADDLFNTNAVDFEEKTLDYTIEITENSTLFVLGSATSANRTFKFPNDPTEGFLVYTLNNSNYEMTVKPFDENEFMQGTGNGYGWTGTKQGCFGGWIYNLANTTWYPINSMGGGLWIVEGLKIWTPFTEMNSSSPDANATNTTNEKSNRHLVSAINGLVVSNATPGSYPSSILLNGTDEHFTAIDSPDWDIMSSLADNWCIIQRVRFDVAGVQEDMLSQVEAGTDEWWIIKQADNKLNFTYETSLGTGVALVADTALSATTWYTVMIAKVAGEIGIYFGTDNTLSQDAYHSTAWTVDSFTAILDIGNRTLFFDGMMNDTVIFNQNIFNAAPNVGKTDTVTIPTNFNFVTGG